MHSIHPIEMNVNEMYVIVVLIHDQKERVIKIQRWEIIVDTISEVDKIKSFFIKYIQTNDAIVKVNNKKHLKDFDSVPKIDGVEMFLVFDTLAKADTYLDYLYDLYKVFHLETLPWKETLAHLKTAFYRKTQRFEEDEAARRREQRELVRQLGC